MSRVLQAIVLATFCFFTLACFQRKEQQPVTVAEYIEPEPPPAPEPSPEEEKQPFSSDVTPPEILYLGLYIDTLLTTSDQLVEVRIELTDSIFRKTTHFLYRYEPKQIEEGQYTWEGNIITLKGVEVPNRYLWRDRTLYGLNLKGEIITPDERNRYTFRQKQPQK